MLLAESLRDADSPHCRAVLFRRTYPELEEVWARADRLLPTILPGVKASSSTHEFRLPAGGKLFLRHLAEEDSVQIHRSSEYSFIGFDELTTFTEAQYRFLFSRARSAQGLNVRIRAATNPGGVGHEWVKKRWAPWIEKDYQGDKAKAGEIWYYLTHPRTGADIWVPEGTQGALSRTFIPARLSDNRALVEADPEYAARLASLDPLTRAQLAAGSWDARPAPGLFFRREWAPVVSSSPSKARRVRAWDRAATEASHGRDPDWTVGLRLSHDPESDLFFIEHVERLRGNPGTVKSTIKALALAEKESVEQALALDPGQAGVFEGDEYLKALVGAVVSLHRETGDKITRARAVSALFAPSPGSSVGRFRLVDGPWVPELLAELEAFPSKEHDDQVDALSLAFRVLASGGGIDGVSSGLYARYSGSTSRDEDRDGWDETKKSARSGRQYRW
jgi:predicted phage terminase large subunit-like protein